MPARAAATLGLLVAILLTGTFVAAPGQSATVVDGQRWVPVVEIMR